MLPLLLLLLLLQPTAS
jgi:hypothetical protein